MTIQVPMKKCSKCGKESRATTEYFGADKTRRDGLHPQCKVCRKTKRQEVVVTARREGLTQEEQNALDEIDREHAANRNVIEDPKASANGLRLAHNFIDVKEPKLRKKLQEQIDARLRSVRAEGLRQQQEVELESIREQFPTPITLPVGAERDALLNQLQAAVKAVNGIPVFASARAYLESQISELQSAIEGERQAERQRIEDAKAEQDAADKAAADIAAKDIMDWAKPFLLSPMDLKQRDKMRTFCLDMAEKSNSVSNQVVAARMNRLYLKLARMLEVITQDNLPPTDSTKSDTSYYTSGFSTAPVNWNFRTSNEKALLRHFTLECIGAKWANTLPDAPPVIWNPKPPTDTLENIMSRLDEANVMAPQLEEAELRRQKYWDDLKASDPKRYEKESRNAILQVKGNDVFAQRQRMSLKELKERNPEEYERISLEALEPQTFELPTIVYLVPVWSHANPKLRDKMYWPDGSEVRPHEVNYDYRTKAWYLPAEPISAELNFEKQSGPTEAELARMSPEAREFYRGDAATQAASKMFAKPVRITFRKGDRHVEGSGRDCFRHGSWWSEEDVRRASEGILDEPPVVLPPLPQIAVADSFAVRPDSPADLAKLDEPIETPWGRYMRLQKEKSQHEQELIN
jgi:hypothetical protein